MDPLNIPALDEDPRPFVREVSRLLAMASHSPTTAALKLPRIGIANLTAGLDPDAITAINAEFRFGAAEALGTVAGALAEQMASESTIKLLAKRHRARILCRIAGAEAMSQRDLAELLEIKAPNLSRYVRELAEAGLIEPSVAVGPPGKAWTPSPWGWQVLRTVVAGKLATTVPADELAVALETAKAHLPVPAEPMEQTIAKEEVYQRIDDALVVKTMEPLRLSTFYTGNLPDHQRPWELHQRVFKHGETNRPVTWLFQDNGQPWLKDLWHSAEGNPKISVLALDGPQAPTPTIQVLDTIGVQYPLPPNERGLVQDRPTGLEVWEQACSGSHEVLHAGERVLIPAG